jgi:uncharacterized protein YdaU (DUF1376 family)
MHYYKRNIGDYAKKAGRLTMLQHGAYTLLIDACYDREEYPTLEEAIDWAWATTPEEEQAVQFVLRRFFIKQDDGRFLQPEIETELDKYRKNAETNRLIAIEREAKRKQNSTNRAQSVNEPPPNHKPLTINQEQRTINQEPDLIQAKSKNKTLAESVTRPECVSTQVWNDWLSIRKKKNAPLTKTAWQLITTQAQKAGWPIDKVIQECILRTWASFKAEWIDEQPKLKVQQLSFRERDELAKRKAWEEMTGRKWPEEDSREVIDMNFTAGLLEHDNDTESN